MYPELPAAKSMATISKGEKLNYKELIDRAKLVEFKCWIDLDVVSIVDSIPEKANLIQSRWVETWKLNSNGTVKLPKCRLVLKGYQDQDKFSVRIDSPTVSIIGVRLLLQLAAIHSWSILSIDLKVAFLQGDY